MLPENRSFWIRGDDGHEYGPVDLAELREWVAENRAGLGTEVRRDDMGAPWNPWQSYPELVALLAEVQVTSPVPGQPGLAIAPIGRRMLAFALDLILSSILSFPILYVLMSRMAPDWQDQFTQLFLQPTKPMSPELRHYALIGNVVTFLILAIYMAGFHSLHGRTPGKSTMRLRVVDQNGNTPGFTKLLLRGLVLAFSVKLLFIPLIYVFLSPQRRALHDFIAGTYVIEA